MTNASLGAPASPHFGEIISWYGLRPDPRQVQALMDMPPPRSKQELH